VVDQLLTDAAAVEAFCRRAQAAGSVALDTEFLWERTYAPQLCLVQLAVAGEVALVDPLAGVPLAPVAALVGDPSVRVVMHAPSADLLAFGLAYATRPAGIVDTQLVAGFVGLTATASLERLLADAIGVTVSHHESFSDWRQRPLTAAQVAYAGDDVRYLHTLEAELARRLAAQGRAEWARDELARRYPDAADTTPDPREAWRKVARRGRLSGRHLAVLVEVASWREREARRRDIPASWVVKDPTLVEVARVAPQSEEALRRLRGVSSSIRRQDAETLLAAVADGLASDPVAAPSGPSPAVKRRADAASGLAGALLRVRCSDAGIAPELVATRGELDRFIEAVVLADYASDPLAQGWRRELVGDELVALVEGRVTLSLRARAPYLAITPLP
jgi:ribonuclease D